jgi:hypothetical protein
VSAQSRVLSLANRDKDVANQNATQKRGLKEQWADFCDYFLEWKHAKVLFATSAAWFLFFCEWNENPYSEIKLTEK